MPRNNHSTTQLGLPYTLQKSTTMPHSSYLATEELLLPVMVAAVPSVQSSQEVEFGVEMFLTITAQHTYARRTGGH